MSLSEQDMLGLFVQEAEEHLAALESGLLALESNPADVDLLNRLFRAIHSVKGTAGFFGLTPITDLAHAMESVMSFLRDGKMVADGGVVSAFLAATDKLRLMVADPINAGAIDAAAERVAIERMLGRESGSVAAESLPPRPVALEGFQLDPVLVRRALEERHNFYVVKLRLRTDIEAKKQTILDYYREVESLGMLLDSQVCFDMEEGLKSDLTTEATWALLFATAMEPDLLLGAFDLEPSALIEVDKAWMAKWAAAQPVMKVAGLTQPVAAAAPAPAARVVEPPASVAAPSSPAPTVGKGAKSREESGEGTGALPAVETGAALPIGGPRSSARSEETVRISVSTLDALMNLAGEMVLGRNQLLRLAAARGAQAQQDGLSAVVQGINGVTTDLQRTIMRARLQPVGGLLGKFNRVVRDLGQKLGKDIVLETHGDEVELDRALIEGLSDPLTHLVRNSADHGIEPPEDRRRAGKPAAGRIRIAASHVSGRVQIEVRDDGRGLDPVRIKAKAVEKGLITAEQAARMSDPESWQLIFAPGFSTAAQVTDVSGRGVGMDVVKTNIERLGGRVEIQSAIGKGTSVVIRLPLTLAIIPALIVGEDGQRFAVPQLNLEEIVRLSPNQPIERVGEAPVLRLRKDLLPVLRLADVLGCKVAVEADQGYVLVLRLDNRRFGLWVSEVDDTEEIVVKPLGRHLQGTGCYSGATLLGQGEIALILDPAGLAQGRLPPESDKGAVAALAQEAAPRDRVLLFRDGGAETYALHVANISRIEKVPRARIERVGDQEFLRQAGGPTLRLLRVGRVLPVSAPVELPEEVHVVVPRLVHHAVGLLASEIVDADDLPTDTLEQGTVRAPGLLGSATIRDRLTLVLDLYGLLAAAGIRHLAPPEGAFLKEVRVLFAEDTGFFREAVRRALDGQVGLLDIVNDGEEAWALLTSRTYDVLITDIEMPRLNGLDLTARVRSDPRLHALPVVALSARGSDDFRDRARQVGVNVYETKLDRERLLQALAEVLAPVKAAAPVRSPVVSAVGPGR